MAGRTDLRSIVCLVAVDTSLHGHRTFQAQDIMLRYRAMASAAFDLRRAVTGMAEIHKIRYTVDSAER